MATCQSCIKNDVCELYYHLNDEQDVEKRCIFIKNTSNNAEKNWVNTKERMPEKTDHYLITYTRAVCPPEMAVAFYSVEEAMLDSTYSWEFKTYGDVKEVTHWKPLPELPLELQKGGAE